MAPEEVIDRAKGAYIAGLISLPNLERYIALAIRAEKYEREVDYMQTLSLPFPWTIEKALVPV